MSNGMYTVGGEEKASAPVSDVAVLATKTEGLRQVLVEKVREDKSRDEVVSNNFRAIERRLAAAEKSATKIQYPTDWGHIRALILRYGFLGCLFVMACSGALVGYTGQFENAELNQVAWAGLWFPGAAAVTLLLPAWFTRRK